MGSSLIARVKGWLGGGSQAELGPGEPLHVQHTVVTRQPSQPPRFPYTCYYRTEVRNDGDVPLRIERFESCFFERGKWKARNVLRRRLGSVDFDRWYNDGVPAVGGWIPAHSTAVCDPNWHGNSTGRPDRVKWAYEAVDDVGRVYRAAVEVPPSICREQRSSGLAWSITPAGGDTEQR